MNRIHPGKPPSQRTEPGDWRAKARKATDLLIAMTCHFEGDDPDTIREAVTLAARKAMSGASGDEIMQTVPLDQGEGRGVEPTEVVSSAGVLRLIAIDSGLDFTKESTHEVFVCEVQRRVEEVLADPTLLAGIRSGGKY